MQELQKFLPQRVLVRRDGRDDDALVWELVPGDVLLVREGDKIPADARLVTCDGITVDNAPLTGESQPISLEADPVDVALTESDNLVFAGCTVLKGSGQAVVFATGVRTEFGKIAALAHEIRRKLSPLEVETGHMIRVLTVIAVAMGATFFTYGVFAGRPLWVNLVFMMGIIVANVPEGLLPTFTLSLAIASLRMAKRNVLVKSLNAVEALGAVHVICTDKTGTLTENRLAVTCIASPLGGAELDPRQTCSGLELALSASDVERRNQSFAGDPLDVAIAEHLEGQSVLVDQVLQRVVRRFPFDVDKRRSAGVVRHEEAFVFAVKGAWESLKPLVAHVEAPDGQTIDPLDDRCVTQAETTVHRLATQGFRVIALAYRRLDAQPGDEATQDHLEHDLVLKGFIGLEDPLRPEVPDAVKKCHQAGIRVLMITGDHPDTAVAIARRARIVRSHSDPAKVVTGDRLAHMRERELIEQISQGVNVFARTTPEQKMKIVAALHEMDQVVAVTGDGVNDAPALKAADVGIAMGRGGTDVARESAQVILLDDNFASIVAGIEEGRTIFANIRKFTNYVLVSNGPEIIPYLLYVLLPVPLALTVIQILSIDLGTDIVPSMGLGQEPSNPEVMRQPPRKRDDGLLTLPLILHSYGFLGLVEAAFSLSLFFFVLVQGGWAWGQELGASDPLYRSATGITLSAIVLMQIGNLLGRRSRLGLGIDRAILTNPFIMVGIGFEVFLSWAILYVPPVSNVLGTGRAAFHVYAVAWLGVPLIFGLDYLRKQIVRRLDANRAARTGSKM